MRKFKITAVLPNGDEVHSNVVATSAEAAVERIKASAQFIEFLGDFQLEDVYFLNNGSEEVKPIDTDTCRLTTFEGVGCAVEHLASGAIVGFEEGRFNATAQVLTYPYAMTPEGVATVLREVGEWLYIFHLRKVLSLREITDEFMKKNKITRRALALELGISETTVSNYLSGQRALPYEQLEHLILILQQAKEI